MANCPRGHGPLHSGALGDIRLAVCLECGGLQLDAPSLALATGDPELAQKIVEYGKTLAARAPIAVDGNQMAYLKCPECAQSMARQNFQKCSGIMVDVCIQHGTWFDGAELPRAIEFLVRGGLDKRARFEAREAETDKRGKQAIKTLEQRAKQSRQGRRYGALSNIIAGSDDTGWL